MLHKEFKDAFAWIYKYLKNIPLELVQHGIKLDISIPLAHQTRYRLNLNYVVAIKQDMDKLFNNWIHSTNRRRYMVITHNGSA
jgi:hypothetical protein